MIKTTLFTVFKEGRIVTKDTTEDFRYAWGIWDEDAKLLYDYGFAQTRKAIAQQVRAAMNRRRQERDLELNRQFDSLLTDEEAYGNVKVLGARVLSENAFLAAMQERSSTAVASALALPDMWVARRRKYTYFKRGGIKYDTTPDTRTHAFAIFSEGKDCAVEWNHYDSLAEAVEAAKKALAHWQQKSTALMKEKLSNLDLSPDPYGLLSIEIADFVDEDNFKKVASEHTREQVQELLTIGEDIWNKPDRDETLSSDG